MSSGHQHNGRVEVGHLLEKLKHLDLTELVHYNSTRPVAQGGFGDIYKGYYRQSGSTKCSVAIKRLRVYVDGRGDATRVFVREIRAWSKLKHPNVLPLAGYMLEGTDGQSPCLPSLVSDWMENGNILEFVKNNRGCDILRLALGMAEGLAYLHLNEIIHSDFKSGNILVSPNSEALVCDFGAVHISHESQTAGTSSTVTGLRGSTRWLAYELLAHSELYPSATKSSDTWAFGMTLLEVLTEDHPFAPYRYDGQVVLAIIQGKLPSPPTQHKSGYQHHLWDICFTCWNMDPSQRLPMAVIALHIQSIKDGKEEKDFNGGFTHVIQVQDLLSEAKLGCQYLSALYLNPSFLTTVKEIETDLAWIRSQLNSSVTSSTLHTNLKDLVKELGIQFEVVSTIVKDRVMSPRQHSLTRAKDLLLIIKEFLQ